MIKHRALTPSATIGVTLTAVATAFMFGTSGASVAAPTPAPTDGQVRGAGAADAVKDSYIVVLKNNKAEPAEVSSAASTLTTRYGGTARQVYSHSIRGFSVNMTLPQANHVAADSEVAYVEQDRKVKASITQPNPPSWGLDRIDQIALPLDQSYTYPATASNVHAYVLDTGIRFTHSEFGGRATAGFDAFGGTGNDCNGHGTHLAGTIGGTNVGVAKAAQLVSVRVLDCTGSGTLSGVISGVDWVTAYAVKPAVANMSLGGPKSAALDNSVRASIASGVTYSVSAGNEAADACSTSPADVTEAITTGATDETDFRASFSNFGTCVALFAPGVNIVSAGVANDTSLASLNGTSQAAPHATGAAALLLSLNPTLTAAQVRGGLLATAVPAAVHGIGPGSPDKLLHVGGVPSMSPPFGLLALANARYVTAENAGTSPLIANRTQIGGWEQLQIVNNGDGSIALRSLANGRYVTAANGGASPLIANRPFIDLAEMFFRIAGPPALTACPRCRVVTGIDR